VRGIRNQCATLILGLVKIAFQTIFLSALPFAAPLGCAWEKVISAVSFVSSSDVDVDVIVVINVIVDVDVGIGIGVVRFLMPHLNDFLQT